jgi:hypothetical protein
MRRLSTFGYKENYVRRKVLPDWWEDCIALNPAGYEQAITLLARNLGLDPRSLQEEGAPLRCREFNHPKYKLKPSDTPEQVAVATCIAARAAQLACRAMPASVAELPSSAVEIRGAILNTGVVCIRFEVLLDYCWRIGIPVLHVSEFPAGARKPDALAVIVDGRPAIVLCKHTEYSAWLLFHLAHELGHIILGHLQDVSILVDEEVKADTDTEETEANQFAVELLTGYKQRSYNYGDRITAMRLAVVALAVGRDTDVDPGFIALSHGRMTGNWGAANGALKVIERKPDALAMMRACLLQYLDRERLSRDSGEFLMRITGVDDVD